MNKDLNILPGLTRWLSAVSGVSFEARWLLWGEIGFSNKIELTREVGAHNCEYYAIGL
jgi:hypothetical protein